MIEVGVKYSSVKQVETLATYRCKSCGHQAMARVRGFGHGSADASHLLGNYKKAQVKAAHKSEIEAYCDVERMLGLVKCPKCGARGSAWVWRFIAGLIFKTLGVFICASLITIFIFKSDIAALVVGILAALIYLCFFHHPYFEWKKPALCVKFISPASEHTGI